MVFEQKLTSYIMAFEEIQVDIRNFFGISSVFQEPLLKQTAQNTCYSVDNNHKQ